MKQRHTWQAVVTAPSLLIMVGIFVVAMPDEPAVTAGALGTPARTTSSDPTHVQRAYAAACSYSAPEAADCVDLQMLIPLYSYPYWWIPDWYIWDDVAAASKRIRITAIINPSNGPGEGCPNSDYERGLQDLRDAGIVILGYVDTNHGNRPIDEVKRDVDLYSQPCFNIHGIFFDQVFGGSCSAERCDYYQELYDYVKSRPGLDAVVCNPGTQTDECYLSLAACDTVVIFEGYSDDWQDYQPCPYVLTYPPERIAMIIHSVPNTDTMKYAVDLAVDRNVGYVYVTDDTMPNPYDTLPSYWEDEVNYIWWPYGFKIWLPLVMRNH